MSFRKLFVMTLCLLAVGAFPLTSHAVSNLTVQINGTTVTGTQGCSNPAPSQTSTLYEVILSGCDGEAVSYGSITIAGKAPHIRAKVVGADADPDEIRLENALITANTACSSATNGCGDIALWASFDAPPVAANVSVTFYREAANVVMTRPGSSPAATGDWFKVTGWVDTNEIWGFEKKTVTCTNSSTCYTWNFTRTEDWPPPSLTGSRQMKTEFWFYQKQANDQLSFDSVKVRNSGGGSAGGGGAVGGGPDRKIDRTRGDGYSHGESQ